MHLVALLGIVPLRSAIQKCSCFMGFLHFYSRSLVSVLHLRLVNNRVLLLFLFSFLPFCSGLQTPSVKICLTPLKKCFSGKKKWVFFVTKKWFLFLKASLIVAWLFTGSCLWHSAREFWTPWDMFVWQQGGWFLLWKDQEPWPKFCHHISLVENWVQYNQEHWSEENSVWSESWLWWDGRWKNVASTRLCQELAEECS